MSFYNQVTLQTCFFDLILIEHLVMFWPEEAVDSKEVLRPHEGHNIRSVSIVRESVHETSAGTTLYVAIQLTVKISHDDDTVIWF